MSCSEVVSPLEGEKSCVRWGLVDEGGGLEGGGWVVTKRKCRLVSLSATQKTLLRKLERCDDMLRSS
jgi:hypothetical protein